MPETALTNGIGRISALKPYKFTDENGVLIGQGFLAEDVRQVIPELSRPRKDQGMNANSTVMKYQPPSSLVPTLVSAFQALALQVANISAANPQTVQALTETVAALNASVAQLTQSLNALTTRVDQIKPFTQTSFAQASIGNVWSTKSFPAVRKATVTNGIATFYLTESNAADGNTLFNKIHLDSVMLMVANSDILHTYGEPQLSADKKILTISVQKSVSVELLGVKVLAALAPANGSIVKLIVLGE